MSMSCFISKCLMCDTRDPWPEQEQAREESRALGGDEWRYPVYNLRIFAYIMRNVIFLSLQLQEWRYPV